MRIRKEWYPPAEEWENKSKKRKGSWIGAITLINALFLLVGILCWTGTYLRNETLNECLCKEHNHQSFEKVCSFMGYNLEPNKKKDVVIFQLENGTRVELEFGESSVKIVDSYRISTLEEQTKIILFVQSVLDEHGKEMTRDLTDYIGEYRLHCILYELGYARDQTKDVDLEYGDDPRWYVNLFSRLIGLLGI